jgi:hypothetical protein
VEPVAEVVEVVVEAAETQSDWTSKSEGTKVTGSMFEGGADLVVTEGTVNGKQAKWHTIRQLNGADFRVNWTADLTDDNTISLSREFPNGSPGSRWRSGRRWRSGWRRSPGRRWRSGSCCRCCSSGRWRSPGRRWRGGGGGQRRGGGGGAPGPVTLKRVP